MLNYTCFVTGLLILFENVMITQVNLFDVMI